MPNSGRPIPELVVGPFGVAVIHEMGPREAIRRVGNTWEARTRDGWMPTEYPLERVKRDAERVRHWLTESDLDFVVRVYAALVTTDASIARSPLCAVITRRPDPRLVRGAAAPTKPDRRSPRPPGGAGPRRGRAAARLTAEAGSRSGIGW